MSKGKLYDVTVTAENDSSKPDGIAFSLTSKLKQNGMLTFSKKTDGMKQDDYYLLEFDLVDNTSEGALRFAPNLQDALWVQRVPANSSNPQSYCPTTAMHDAEFEALNVLSPTKLLVRNRDSNVELFAFALNFVRGTSTTLITYDPIGDNRNYSGGGGISSFAAAATAVGTAVAGTLVYLGLRKQQRPEKTRK